MRVRDEERERVLSYFGTGKLSSRNEGGYTLQLEYDTEERLTALVNEAGDLYEFETDAAGRVTAEVEFDGSRTRYERDDAGRVTTLTRPSGATSRYSSAPLGRRTEVEHSDGAVERFVYSPAGLLLEASNELCTVRYERDAAGRVVREWQDEAWIDSTYDRSGRRLGLTSSLGARHAFDFDRAGFVASLRMGRGAGLAWAAAFERDAGGHEIERRLPGGVRSRWRRDLAGRPVEHVVEAGRERSRHLRIQWAGSERIASNYDVVLSLETAFGHDARGHMIWSRRSDGVGEIRSADAVGNLFRRDDHGDRRYGPGGQLLVATSEAGEHHFRYDLDGRLVSRVDPDGGEWTFAWDVVGNLRSVCRPDGGTITYDYDALRRRISRTNGGETTRYVWDGNVVLHEERGEELTTWLFEPETLSPAACLRGDRACSVVSDERGAPVALFDGRGQRVWSTGYSIYGELRDTEGPRGACPFRLLGQAEDEDTGLYYNRFRWYDPKLGLYISKDPAGLLGGERLYAYVSDLFVWYDPFGLIKAPPSLPDTPGVYILSNGKRSYVGSSGIGKQGMNTRVSSSSHRAAQELLAMPRTKVEYVPVNFPEGLTDRSDRNNILRHFEAIELERQRKKGFEMDNIAGIQAASKKAEAVDLINNNEMTLSPHRQTCK